MKKQPGRIREKLAELLREANIEVDPYDLWTQEGAYRSRYWDLARLGAEGKWITGVDPDGRVCIHQITICSWDTMTDCVRNGINLSEYDGWSHVEVHRKEKAKP